MVRKEPFDMNFDKPFVKTKELHSCLSERDQDASWALIKEAASRNEYLDTTCLDIASEDGRNPPLLYSIARLVHHVPSSWPGFSRMVHDIRIVEHFLFRVSRKDIILGMKQAIYFRYFSAVDLLASQCTSEDIAGMMLQEDMCYTNLFHAYEFVIQKCTQEDLDSVLIRGVRNANVSLIVHCKKDRFSARAWTEALKASIVPMVKKSEHSNAKLIFDQLIRIAPQPHHWSVLEKAILCRNTYATAWLVLGVDPKAKRTMNDIVGKFEREENVGDDMLRELFRALKSFVSEQKDDEGDRDRDVDGEGGGGGGGGASGDAGEHKEVDDSLGSLDEMAIRGLQGSTIAIALHNNLENAGRMLMDGPVVDFIKRFKCTYTVQRMVLRGEGWVGKTLSKVKAMSLNGTLQYETVIMTGPCEQDVMYCVLVSLPLAAPNDPTCANTPLIA